MNELIKVSCYTNLDDYNATLWPLVLQCRPMVGDYIRSKDDRKELRIVRITHTNDYLLIELHKGLN